MSKVILITGGSRGIGAATALLAAERGYTVCINYKQDRTAADNLVNHIESSRGKAFAIQADISHEEDVMRLFKIIDDKVGTLTALVNNAGIVDLKTTVREMTAQRLHRMFNVNVIGSFLCAREAVKRMSTRYQGNGGSIVNLSSAGAKHGSPNQYVDYAASKGAIDIFTVGLSKEVAEEGIRVNAVRPGIIYTDIHADSGDANRVDKIKDSIPMKRGGNPEEVAKAILWLLSDDASYVTGSILDVSGGR